MKIDLKPKPLKAPQNFHEWCLAQIPIYQWSNQSKEVITTNRTQGKVIHKRLTKSSSLNKPMKFYSFAIVLVSKKKVEIQSHCYWHEVIEGKESLEYDMTNFERFSKGQHLQANRRGGNWFEGLLSNYGFMSGAYTNTKFYRNDWVKQLNNNHDLKYLTLPTIDTYQLRNVYKYRNEIEYLQKIGATNIAQQLINGYPKIDKRILTKKWLKVNKSLLKKNPAHFSDIMVQLYFRKHKMKLIPSFEKLIAYSEVKKLKVSSLSAHFQKWLLKQDETYTYYRSYLNLVKRLEIPLNSDLVIMPRNLKKKYNEYTELLNMMKYETENKMIEDRLQTIRKYELDIDGYSFLVPKSINDIIKEGKELAHCVGGTYHIKEHSEGKSTIVFIRKKNKLKEPYYTLEYKDNCITQIQGKGNRRKVALEVKEASEKWLETITKI